MPQYMLLLYNPVDDGRSPEEIAAEHPQWGAYTEGLKAAGLYVGGEALEGTDTATTVRVRNGETQITDGPFAETKEYINGYYLLNAPDLDAAIAQAAKVPLVGRGAVEVRPVMDLTALEERYAGQETATA